MMSGRLRARVIELQRSAQRASFVDTKEVGGLTDDLRAASWSAEKWKIVAVMAGRVSAGGRGSGSSGSFEGGGGGAELSSLYWGWCLILIFGSTWPTSDSPQSGVLSNELEPTGTTLSRTSSSKLNMVCLAQVFTTVEKPAASIAL